MEHVLERRAALLASRLTAQREVVRRALTPEGERPPFTRQLAKPDALAWWREHRHDDLGQRVLARLRPADVLELDAALWGAERGDGRADSGDAFTREVP